MWLEQISCLKNLTKEKKERILPAIHKFKCFFGDKNNPPF